MAGTIVLLGSLPIDDVLRTLASTFGWVARSVPALEELEQLTRHHKIAAVFLQPHEIHASCLVAIRRVREIIYPAPVVVCQRFSERKPWHELAAMGAFYQLHLPFAAHELRQCLGFIHEAHPVRTEEEAKPQPEDQSEPPFIPRMAPHSSPDFAPHSGPKPRKAGERQSEKAAISAT